MDQEKNKQDGLKLLEKGVELHKQTEDKVVSLASGIIAISVTFLNLEKTNDSNKFFLLLSWIFLSLTIVLWLIHRIIWIRDHMRDGVDFYTNNCKPKSHSKFYKCCMPLLELGPSIFLCLGLLSLVLYGFSLLKN